MATTKKNITNKKVVNKKKIDDKSITKVSNKITTKTSELNTQQSRSEKKNYIIGIILLIVFIAVILFFAQGKNIKLLNNNTNNNINNNSLSNEVNIGDKVIKAGDTVKVDYVGKLQDGTIFDTSIESFAKQSADYSTGRIYEPLEFKVGGGQMIKGFDSGIIGMKLGEKKTLTIDPKDAYGEEFVTQDVPSKYFEDIITQEMPIENFKDTVSQTVPKNMLGEKGLTIKEKEVIEIGNGMKGTVTKIEGDNITIDIQNTENPFYGKKLEKGLSVDYQGNKITIKSLTNSGVTVEIDNKQNPFYGKKLIEGLIGKLPNGEEIKVIKIAGDSVTIQTKNPSKLAGKTLIFDVEVKEIK
ncbi:FKBP-type peptidyl-prolyl cis-trans isomerase [Candidatus Gracilibacteria bacterium]|nr:FKBP-type peptidyl-prolyl cis-trans isomerase [Candidatus Gracilibacteria bacterium]